MDPLLLAPALHPDQDFLPASPHLYDASPNPGAPYDSFDFPDAASHFPHTPSYNGSYQNSPYSNYSDLPAIDGTDDGLHLFADNPSGISITEEYDPAEYDVPSSGGPLILDEHYMNSAHVSVSVTPPLNDYSSPNAFDHASPASSNGLEDDGHSHASSNSSYMHPPSPRPDISQSFQDSLSFHSPAWPAGALPDDRRSPPLSKPQSPPQLVIPDTTSPGGTGVESPPTINAPDGDGGLIGSGPTLQIVPATPVSGGGVTAQNVPFQDTLANLRQGNSAGSDAQDWTHHQQFGAQGGQFADQAFSFPGSSSSSALADDGAQQSQQQFQRGQQYLLPQAPPRSRSLSDTSLRPAPVWDTVPVGDGRQGGTVNMNDVLPGPGQGQSSDPLQQNYRHPSSAGPHQTSFGMNSYNQYASDYLTVETGAIRRAKSDGGAQRPMHTRQARSLDIRPTNSLSPNPGMLFPPPGPAQQDFLRQQQFLHPTEPMPSIRGHHRRSSSSGSRERGIGGMMGIGGGVSMGGIAGWSGSQTSSARASPYPSPSASPRPGYGALPSQDLGLSGLAGPGMGGMMNLNMGMPGSLSGQMGMTTNLSSGNMNAQITVTRRQGGVMQVEMPGTDGGVPMTVTRPHVTTPSTAKASHDRRKQPANFACPVPGCGSTFTRHFNLKGHLRSHAEEKPYQCKWPGCGKGFARQHDCKRHEQLHLNIRPYPCEGCKKNFARMDALNRHLRSEGGAECRKIQEELQPGSTAHLDAPTATPSSDSGAESSAPPSGADVKPDPDGAWTAGGMMM
ncbi:hypothetical protein C8Q76DRAFT_748594 [Earliella scabrosa]|nr:hypothetical protein C8Q76DRAFT_748594 [Earliella scabrosa]